MTWNAAAPPWSPPPAWPAATPSGCVSSTRPAPRSTSGTSSSTSLARKPPSGALVFGPPHRPDPHRDDLPTRHPPHTAPGITSATGSLPSLRDQPRPNGSVLTPASGHDIPSARSADPPASRGTVLTKASPGALALTRVLTGWWLHHQVLPNRQSQTSPIRALRPAAFASLRFASGRPLTASFRGKIWHLPGGRGRVGPLVPECLASRGSGCRRAIGERGRAPRIAAAPVCAPSQYR